MDQNPRLAREYGAKEVTLGFARDNRIRGKTEIVDFLSYDMKNDIYKCYEIKISMQDFKSEPESHGMEIITILLFQRIYIVKRN